MSPRARPQLAIYPGSFDPITRGHEDIVRRTLRFCDGVVVAVSHHATQLKHGLFSVGERLELIQQVFDDDERIEAVAFSGLLVDFARKREINLIVRGLRAVSDFEYEFQMALMNRDLQPGIETLFLAPDARYSFLSASLVREVAALGGDISAFVAPVVQKQILQKLGEQ